MELLILVAVVLVLTSTFILMTQVSELAAKFNALTEQLSKASAEIVAAVAALKEQIEGETDAALSPETEAALARLSAVAQALDDLNPDATPAPVPAPGTSTPAAENPPPAVGGA